MSESHIRDLQEQLRTATGADRAEILIELARDAMGSDLELSVSRAEQAIETAERAGDPELGARARIALAGARLANSDPAIALEIAEDSARLAVRPETRVDALGTAAVAELVQGRPDRAESRLVEALGLVEEHNLPPTVKARVLGRLAGVHRQEGNLPRAFRALYEAQSLARGSGNTRLEASLHQNLGVLLHESGDREEALATYLQAARLYREIGNPQGLALNLLAVAHLHRDLGEGESALQFAEESIAVFREIGHRSNEADALAVRAEALLLAGRVAKAENALSEAMHIFQDLPNPVTEAECLVIRAKLHLERDEHEKAGQDVDRALEIMRGAGKAASVQAAMLVRGRVLAAAGESEAAVSSLEEALSGNGGENDDAVVCEIHEALSDCHGRLGDADRANRHMQTVRRLEKESRRRQALGRLERLRVEYELEQERRHSEEALRESEERYSKAFDSSPNIIVISTIEEGRFVEINRRGAELLGYSREELIGRTSIEIGMTKPVVREEHLRILREQGGFHEIEKTIRRKNGKPLVGLFSGQVLKLGGVDHLFQTIVDITARKEAERALEAAYEEVRILEERLKAENVYLQEEIRQELDFGEIVGECAAMLQLKATIRQVAVTDATVLIRGETGTGKELVAHALHEASGRRDRTLVKVNCSAVAAGLVESELFGHEKGAFTGAHEQRKGRFEIADGGSIFLDEIGDLAAEPQVKLLRVLEEREFERVGSSQPIRVDLRVIAATNRDLEAAIRDGRFRSDLFYRLNVFPVTVPPLRERGEDVILLARHFLRQQSLRLGRRLEDFTLASREWMTRYDWPGNVRELRNLVERAAILAEGATLDLAESVRTVPDVDPNRDLASVQRAHILRVLEETGWRVEGPKGAAAMLGLAPSTLRTRMSKLGVKRP